MYKKVDANLNFVDREKQIEKFWNDNDIFKKSMEHRKEGETYTFYDGPPTANGKPHIGHVETRTIKDMIPRYQTMKGKFVPRKAGWDTHGLPVELEVEKLLGLNGKEQIEEYGMEPFIKKCKESVWKYKGMWEDFSKTVGFWADMDNPYVTYDDNFIESEWWALKEIWNKNLLYKGFKIVPYCPRCGTPLSSQEVAQGYKTVKERSAVARFKVIGEDAYFLAWTTTPWTLPSNVALCVNPDETYCKVKAVDGYTYYMAEALLDTVLGKLLDKDAAEGTKAYEVLETYKGSDLEYKEYEPLFDCAKEIIEKQRKETGITDPQNLEEQALFLGGRDIYEKLIKGYTEKQWGRKCTELPAFIIKRLPFRFVYDNNYFNDRYQGIPVGGYTAIVEKMLEGTEVRTGIDFFEFRKENPEIAEKIIFTGMIDEYFGYQLGALEYRSVRFETEVLDCENYQGNAVVNYTEREVPYTRIIEHKHFEFGKQEKTVISREYSSEWSVGMEPYYPVNDEKNNALFEEYKKLAEKEENVIFGGRLGDYKYYDMDKVVAAALDRLEEFN